MWPALIPLGLGQLLGLNALNQPNDNPQNLIYVYANGRRLNFKRTRDEQDNQPIT